uniref:Uncharacterized protein n=1 Tax=viral metagenome TaxID=1070528 RepID=A0A6C0LUD1_9ZZZZ
MFGNYCVAVGVGLLNPNMLLPKFLRRSPLVGLNVPVPSVLLLQVLI